MPRELRSAVAAAASGLVRRQIIIALSECGLALSAFPQDAPAAAAQVRKLKPDLLLADACLPCMTGASLARSLLLSRSLPVRPAVILLFDGEYALPQRKELEDMGVLFIRKPLRAEALAAALDQLRTMPPYFPAGECVLADRLLDELGMPDHIGRRCIRTAALICAGDERIGHSLTRRLYPLAAEYNHISPAQAERAMRHAIDLAWQSSNFENQYRIFADTVDASRGQPTCGEMILRLADILRLEG